jgi:hypothetical protein
VGGLPQSRTRLGFFKRGFEFGRVNFAFFNLLVHFSHRSVRAFFSIGFAGQFGKIAVFTFFAGRWRVFINEASQLTPV